MAEVRTAQRAPQRRQIFTGTNKFDIDESRKPADMAYKWARKTIGGLPDEENMIMCDLNGWTPVPAERHPELAGRLAEKGSAIVRGGLQLMEQPQEYQDEARQMDRFEAKHTLEQQVQRLGLQSRRNGAKGIRRTVEAIDAEIVE